MGIVFTGCERITNIYTSLHNETDHSVSLLLYKSGIVNAEDTIKLAPNTSLKIGSGYLRGEIKRKIFMVSQFTGLDSIIVIFNDTLKIVHYTYAPSVFALKYYTISSLRNINNAESYELTREGGNNYMDYYFKEQDYLDAKD
jgi:hypothetical protein